MDYYERTRQECRGILENLLGETVFLGAKMLVF